VIPLIEFATREELAQASAECIADALNMAIAARGGACAALSGGATPEPAYRALAALSLDWPKVTFLLVDERFVPPDHPASNENMLRRALASPLSAGAQLIPMFAANASLAEAARRANENYAGQHIDIALLGMGQDGHIASWFLQSRELVTALDPNNKATVMAVHAPGAAGSSERLTLTLAAIARAERRLLLIAGPAKRALIENGAPIAMTLFAAAPTEILWAT
jgi:6-phosphogluconolactonase